MILIGLLYNKFVEFVLNFPTNFPTILTANIIHVRKEETSHIRTIDIQHDFDQVNLSSPSIDLTRLTRLGNILNN